MTLTTPRSSDASGGQLWAPDVEHGLPHLFAEPALGTFLASSARRAVSNSSTRSPNRCGAANDSENHAGHDVVRAADDHPVGELDLGGPAETCRPVDLGLAAAGSGLTAWSRNRATSSSISRRGGAG